MDKKQTTPFLQLVADYLVDHYEGDLGDLCMVFPNRRSGLFFRKYLAERIAGTSWSPEITAINDFICNLSDLEPVDPIETNFLLYDIYKEKIKEPESFDEFFYWGEIMLNDFDDIDKYLVDAGQIFKNIKDIKEVDGFLGEFEEDQIRFIRQFWNNFHEGGQTDAKRGFLALWKLLPSIYEGLRIKLIEVGMGYEGMIYRDVAEKLDKGITDRLTCRKVVFAGFNALNSCEKRIFSHLKKAGRALFFWDYDRRYIKETYWEAGRFLRENLEQFPPESLPEDFEYLDQDREIRIFDMPNDILQAKMITGLLSKDERIGSDDAADTAVVLCDEELLVPVMMSLPDSVQDVNITMGYPFKNTPANSFVELLLTMQKNLHLKSTPGFYHRDVLAILNHPFMRREAGEDTSSLVARILENKLVNLYEKDFESDLGKLVFRKADHADDLHKYLREVTAGILESIDVGLKDFRSALDREYMFQFLTGMNRLNRIMKGREMPDLAVYIRFLRKIISGLRIPFSGEPLSGLQVMGILETRLLDFRKLVILSMNEDIMPGAQIGQSLIPYSLRIGYRMPTREDRDAIYAYYFYRLIQRADRVDLLYNSNTEGVKSGEMSRYLHQLKFKHELAPIRPVVNVESYSDKQIIIQKSPVILQKLGGFYEPEGTTYLSPSALNTFLDCSLKYYFRYMAGIGEKPEVNDSVDAIEFGNILHNTIKILYDNLKDPDSALIQPEELETLLGNQQPAEVLQKVFLKEFYGDREYEGISGTNILIFRVMLKYILKIIENDLAIAPFTVVALEDLYSRKIVINHQGRECNVRLGGKIDRIDRIPYHAAIGTQRDKSDEGRIRVIDYKTGSAILSFKAVDRLFDRNENGRNKAGFQTLLYAWLVKDLFPEEHIIPGLYVMKNLFNDEFDPAFYIGQRSDKKRLDSFSDVEHEFGSLLLQTVTDLFDPDIAFVQTENEDNCKYCDYRRICNRAPFD